MKSKILTLGLVGLIGCNSLAVAANDRTAGIGDQQIAVAKNNLSSIKQQLLILDNSLVKAKESIELRESKGTLLAGAAVTTAAIGIGSAAASYLAIRRVTIPGSELSAYISGMFSILSGAASLGTSVGAQMMKPNVNKLNELHSQLAVAEQNTTVTLQNTKDANSRALLEKTQLALKEAKASLVRYSETNQDFDRNKVIVQTTQATGLLLSLVGLRTNHLGALFLGTLVSNSGNLGQIITSLTDREADLVLKEIENTRKILLSTALSIE